LTKNRGPTGKNLQQNIVNIKQEVCNNDQQIRHYLTNYHTPPSVYSVSGRCYSGVPLLSAISVDFYAGIFWRNLYGVLIKTVFTQRYK